MSENNWVLLAIALLNAVTAFMSWKSHGLIRQVEIATNSMKDALVKSTGDARFAEGREAGREQQRGDSNGTV
jgi:hypothetical protein